MISYKLVLGAAKVKLMRAKQAHVIKSRYLQGTS